MTDIITVLERARKLIERLPPSEVLLTYASILEKPRREVSGGFLHPPGEISLTAASALRACAALARAQGAEE